MPRRYHRGMARQCPRGHDDIKPGEVADNMSVYHLTRHAPALAVEKAKQLEIKLEVAMAEILSFRGEGDKSVQGQSTRSRGQAGALFVIMVKQHMPWDGLNGGRTRCWRIRKRGAS
jgi:hypothetical protein